MLILIILQILGIIEDYVARIVPTYHPAGEHGSEAKGEKYDEQIKWMTQEINKEDLGV